MKIDLEKMNREELTELRERIDAALGSLAERERQAAIQAAEEAARQHGYSLSELGVAGSAKGRGKRKSPSRGAAVHPPKYRHPTDPRKTWSGRGRKPQWIKEAEEQGTLEKLAI
jgi:DNA-binding protein H-NS